MRFLLPLAFLATSAAAHAGRVVDDFEAGLNPDGWAWGTPVPGDYGVVTPTGGNPGGWVDSTGAYLSDHPMVSAFPEPGTPLRAALDSGTLMSASADIQRLVPAADPVTCPRTSPTPSTFELELVDMHTIPSSPPTPIMARTRGPEFPGTPFPWMSLHFPIPASSDATPDGWSLDAPEGYTWADMLRNVDGITFRLVAAEDVTIDACWHVGADNIVVTYADGDAIFADGFDALP